MKILLACQQSPAAYALPAYAFWRHYFVSGLREAGHEVYEVPGADWARGLLPLSAKERARWLDEQWSRTLAEVKNTSGLDLFLGYLYPGQIDPSGVQAIRAAGLPTVNFFCDHLREFRHLPKQFAPFDLHWVPELAALPLYAARGWKALHAPMPCWVSPQRRVIAPEINDQLTFIGRRDALRGILLSQIARSGLPLRVYGANWRKEEAEKSSVAVPPSWTERIADWRDFYARRGLRASIRRGLGKDSAAERDDFDFTSWTGSSPDDEGYARLTSNSAITLGINRCPSPDNQPDRLLVYSRLRDIEAPMLGACYLTEWAPELPGFYEIGQDIEVYRNETELIELARALLSDPARRLRLRQAALRRAHADHSIGATMRKISANLSS